jgi:8-oxo-dGTP pyrophosphatase MutT (NUDIX family)
MPKGLTEYNQKADGSVVLIFYNDLFLMAQETKYLTDEDEANAIYKKATGMTLQEAFLSEGSTESPTQLRAAKMHFATLTEELEQMYPEIPHITYADVKDSQRIHGLISAKPRYVAEERRTLFGFPKGSYEHKDNILNMTAFRECQEETGISLQLNKLVDKRLNVPTGHKGQYAVYHYKLTKEEFENFSEAIEAKNKDRENELHNIQFIKIPKGDHFRLNAVLSILNANFGGLLLPSGTGVASYIYSNSSSLKKSSHPFFHSST